MSRREHGTKKIKLKPEKTDRDELFDLYLFNPKWTFLQLEKLFSPFFFLGWLLIPGTPIAALILTHHYPQYLFEIQSYSARIGISSVLIRILAILFTASLITRIVQGTVITHYGPAPTHFGIKLLFGVLPRFSVPKRGVRQLPRRAQLWIYASSLLTRLAMFVVGMMIWYCSADRGHSLYAIGMFLAIVGFGSFLFIANPLWPADGYNWLATYVNYPQLRNHAFLVLKMILLRRRLPAELSPVRRNSLLAFAVGAIAFTVFIKVMVLLAMWDYLEGQYGGTGVCIWVALFLLFLYWLTLYLTRHNAN